MINKPLKEYLNQLDGVMHTTLDPNGPGVVRIHLIPPKIRKIGYPFVCILNGQNILPVNTTYGVIIAKLIENINAYYQSDLKDNDFDIIAKNTLNDISKLYKKAPESLIKEDIKDILDVLVKVARNEKPDLEIGYMSIQEYAKYLNAPLRMDLMVSSMQKDNHYNCNHHCMFCYAGDQSLATVDEIDTDSWKKIIDKLKEAGVSQLTFTGGEATFRDDLVSLVDYAKFFVTRLNTNGVLLSSKLARELYDASLDSVQITLYSANEDIHNMLTGSKCFKQTIEGIKNALNANLNVSINTPLCTLNENYLETLKYLHSLGIKYFTFSSIIETGNATDNLKLVIEKDKLSNIISTAKKYCDDNNLEIDFTTPGALDKSLYERLHMKYPLCGACLSNMAIAPNGDVIPCQSYLSLSLGNLLNDSFNKIFTSKKTKSIQKQAILADNGCLLKKEAN